MGTVTEPPKKSKLSEYKNVVHKRQHGTRVVRRGLNTNMDTMFGPEVPTQTLSRPSIDMYTGRNALNPIYDTSTQNTSFVDVANQLEMLGIQNNKFHLLLLNPLLQGVNPHDPNLTAEEAMMIVQECKLNGWYYLRECVMIEEQGGGLVHLRMNRGELAACYNFFNNVNWYLMIPRQTGKTVIATALLSWAYKFGGPNADMMFSAYRPEVARKNLRAMKTIISHLPRFMANMGTVAYDSTGKRIRGTNSATMYRDPTSNNSAMIAPACSTEDAADTNGRGYSQLYQYYDEAEFTKYIDTMVKVSGMAFNTASRNARKNHAGYCRMFTTTPGDLSNTKACQSALKIVKDAMPWKESFYDMGIYEYKALLKHKSKFRIVYIEYDYKSLGLGEEWFIEAVSNVGGDVDRVKREILLMRFHGNSNSPFTNDEIEDVVEHEQKPIGIKVINRIYEILFYEKPKKGRLYFMGLDPSDGTGSDNYALTILDPYELKVVAEFRSPYMTVHGCVDLITWLVDTYFNNVMIVVERNKNGGSVVEALKESKLRNRVYCSPKANDDTIRISDEMDENGFIKETFIRNKYFGTNTTTSTRQVMMNILLDAMHFARNIITSKYIVDDIKHLVVKNNKIQAAQGEHDDSIMSWLLVMYIYYHGEELERYGFDRTRLPNDVYEDDEFDDLAKLYANPEIKRQFPSFYSYYLQQKEIHDRKVKEEKDKLLNTFKMQKIGGLDDAFAKATPIPDIDDVDPDAINLEEDIQRKNAKKRELIQRFLALNK